MMKRPQKEAFVSALREDFVRAQAAFLVNVKGMSVKDMETLRNGLRETNGRLKVAKNTLLKRATADVSGAGELHTYLGDQLAVVFAYDEPVGVAQVLEKTTKTCEELAIVAGCMDGGVFEEKRVHALAHIPPRDQLLSQIAGGIQSPARSIAMGMKQVITQIARGVDEVAKVTNA